MSRFAKFNPQLFWSLPPQFRLRFALKFLYGFEELYSDGIKTDFILNRDEICGMIFMLLHLRNEYYISPIDLKLMESIKTGKHFMKNRIFKMLFNYPYSSPYFSNLPSFFLPVSFPSVWRLNILAHCIKNSSYFAIESICKFDPSVINSSIEMILRYNEFDEKDRLLLLIPKLKAVVKN